MKNFQKFFFDKLYIIVFITLVGVFFYPFIFFGKIPIPADTILGMYHPWRDIVWDNYKAGVPFKNFLITDPVRQQYIWRFLAIDQLKKGKLPIWNPYSFSGTPLLANFQTAAFYPFNIIFLLIPFNQAWGGLIFLQPLLAGIFLYLYLRYMAVSKEGSLLASFAFSFSGFSVSWLEWNTILHTALWLPLILLAEEHIIRKVSIKWSTIMIFALVSQILAGHLQILFYSLVTSNLYFLIRLIHNYGSYRIIILKKTAILFLITVLSLAVTFIQWYPTYQFISLSARTVDQQDFKREGFFLPTQNLIQFIAPDFFGNPAKGNYWGIWNYGEFIGYIGLIPLIFAFYACIFRRDKKTIFFSFILIISLLLSLSSPLAKFLFELKIPLLSSSQPTRLMFLIDLSLCILAAFGFDHYLIEKKKKKIFFLLTIFGVLFLIGWVSTYFSITSFSPVYLLISRRNLILPSLLFITIFFIISIYNFQKLTRFIFMILLLILTIFDLMIFAWRYTPFVSESWIFPETGLIRKIQENNSGYHRLLVTDRRIMAPNFAAYYKIQDVAGYDPLYLLEYNKFVSAWNKDKPDIQATSFNRIVTPDNYNSFIYDLLGVRYLMGFNSLNINKFKLLDKEGQTYLYENKDVFPRVFIAENTVVTKNSDETITKMWELQKKLRTVAVISEKLDLPNKKLRDEFADIISYKENYIKIETNTIADRLVVLTDIYYPLWRAYLDGKLQKIYKVDYLFRGVVVPSGDHILEFKANLL